MVFVCLPCINMREGPSIETRVVSQALFAEEVRVLSSQGDWFLIETPDRYTGWVQGGIVPRTSPYISNLETSRLAAHLYAKPDTEFGPLLTLPFGSKLLKIHTPDARWHQVLLPDERIAFIQKGDVEVESFDLTAFSKKFLGLPYTWGGRSSFGYDCSGFIQMLFRRLDVHLPRDAREQIAIGTPTDDLKLGDLIFWGVSEKEIRHVGMFLENETFIHTSTRENKPYLRLSALTDPEWNGSCVYSYRCAKRIALPRKDPEKEDGSRNFCPEDHKNAMKVPIHKGFDFLSPKSHGDPSGCKPENPSCCKIAHKREYPQLKDSACNT